MVRNAQVGDAVIYVTENADGNRKWLVEWPAIVIRDDVYADHPDWMVLTVFTDDGPYCRYTVNYDDSEVPKPNSWHWPKTS